MEFRNQFNDVRRRVVQLPGSGVKITYAGHFNDDGSFELEPKGQEDLYGYIQSHKDSVDIHVLLKQFASGDLDALSKRQGTYGDFTVMPKTYAEMLNRVNDGKEWFESLPVEVRANFNHSFAEFMAAMDSPDFFNRLGFDKQIEDGATTVDPVSVEKAVGGE